MTATDPARDPNAWMYVEGPARRVLRAKLLRRRNHLAAAAAEHHAHDQIGAEVLWRAVETTEAHLRDVFPETWADQQETWGPADVARLHLTGQPWPAICRLCGLNLKPEGSVQAFD